MDIERVSTYTMLGVIVNDRLTATDHVNHLLSSAARLRCVFYAATERPLSLYMLSSELIYCSPAWAKRSRINSFLTRCKRFGFCDNNLQATEVLFSEADVAFFQRIINNKLHVLQTFFTGIT